MLPALLAVLRESSSSEEAQSNALLQLAQLMNDAYDEEAIALCEYMRATGAVQLIASRLSSPVVSIHQYALMLVGNLASLSVDLDAEKTKVLLKTADVFSQILPYIFSEEYATLVYSLAAVQNLCTEIAYVEQLQQAGGLERLQAILQLNDPQLEPFARGCLVNVTQARAANQGTFGYAMGVLSNVLGGGSAAQVLPPARASAPTAAPAPSELRAMKAELEVLEAQGEALGKLEDDELEDDLDDEDEDEGINELWDPEGVHAAKLMALAEKGVRTGRFIKKVRHKGRDRDVSALKVQACYRGHLARRTVLPKALAYPSAPPPRLRPLLCPRSRPRRVPPTRSSAASAASTTRRCAGCAASQAVSGPALVGSSRRRLQRRIRPSGNATRRSARACARSSEAGCASISARRTIMSRHSPRARPSR